MPAALGPPAHTITLPGRHDTCSSAMPGSSGTVSATGSEAAARSAIAAVGIDGAGVVGMRSPVARNHASASERDSTSRSATICSRSSPRIWRARVSASSTSTKRRDRPIRQERRSAKRHSRCSRVARPYNSSSTQWSKSTTGATGEWVRVVIQETPSAPVIRFRQLDDLVMQRAHRCSTGPAERSDAVRHTSGGRIDDRHRRGQPRRPHDGGSVVAFGRDRV